MTNEEAYNYCLEMEEVRECHWRATPQGAFESRMTSRDNAPKLPEPSDGGAGVRQMMGDIDRAELSAAARFKRRRCMRNAAIKVTRKAPECLPTLWAVIRNGTNRKESVWELMRVWANTLAPKRTAKKAKKCGPKGGKNCQRRKGSGNRQDAATVHRLKKC